MTDIKLGLTLRTLRLKQKRTINEIANHCGLSKSMVSKIETDKVFPTVATLTKIAKSLGTSVSSLLEEHGQNSEIVIPANMAEKNSIETEKGYRIYPFASGYKEKKMQPFLFMAKKGEVKEHHVSHEGEEFIYVLEGEMKFQIGDIEYFLRKGDSLYFNALKTHQVIPISDKVKYLDIFV
jgi:transcriptional regulator with XRE-family HTH domain